MTGSFVAMTSTFGTCFSASASVALRMRFRFFVFYMVGVQVHQNKPTHPEASQLLDNNTSSSRAADHSYSKGAQYFNRPRSERLLVTAGHHHGAKRRPPPTRR